MKSQIILSSNESVGSHKSILLNNILIPSSDFRIDMDKEYGVNCSDISLEKIYNHLDVFALGHFVGWAFKAVLIRHMGILWAMSVMWEFTEVRGECV